MLIQSGPSLTILLGGDIECLGRKDNQVKIHGHRIELGEVEQAIVRTDTLKSTAVVASEVNHKTQLSALTVFDPTEKTEFEAPDAHRDDVKRLKEGLNSLPAYMVPKSVVPVGKLPTLPSGKVDRKLIKRWIEDMSAADLSKYSIDDIGPASVAVPVVTDQENILERSWSDILGHEPSHIGALANFFSLGGDSVSAINLVGSCRAAGYSLSVSHVLKNPVLREMATFLKEADAAKNSDTTIEFVIPESLTTQMKDFGLSITDDIDYTYPAPPGQTEFLNQGQRAEQFWVLMTIRPLAESTAVDRWINAVTELTKFNDILRTFYVKSGTDDEWIGVVLKRPVVEVSYHNCTDKDHRSKIIEEAWNERFSFGKPWIRYTIITSPNGSKEVVIKMDHAVYDGTLLRIFDAQFAAIQHGEPLPVHENFKDFALYMWRGDKTDSMKFWTELMVDKTFVYPAADEPRITAMISKPTNIGIDGFATRCSVTPSIVFQTTFQLWLMRTTGLRDVAFDYLLSGRNVELPNPQLINGNLANFLPFRSRLSESDDSSQPLSNYLGETQQLFWEVTENGDVGIDTIYDAAKINRKVLGNRALFLFQPFEPAASAPAESEMRWVVMKGSEVRMYQPYALVVEISKTVDGYQVKVMYDEGVFLKADAERIAMEQIEMMEKMVSEPELKVRDFLDRY